MAGARNILASWLTVSSLLFVAPAHATYSIVATDKATQQVGGAVTSCVGAGGVTGVYGPAPGHGGINAQALSNVQGRNRGQTLLNMDVAPAEIIRQITAPSFDTLSSQRQYGIADLQGRAAAWSGRDNGDYAGDRQGTVSTYTYSIQGNILTGVAVINQTETAFRSQGCDLADKLMLALEGGAQNQQGDNRCTPTIPSDAASIEVDLAGMPAGSYLRLSIALNKKDPLGPLRTMFNTWRATHPCAGGNLDGGLGVDASRQEAGLDATTRPDVTVDATANDDATGGTAGDTGSGGSGGTVVGGGGTGGASTGTGGSQGGKGGTLGIGTAGTAGSENGGEDAGCACRVRSSRTGGTAGNAFGYALAVTGLLAARRRLRRHKNS